MPMTIPFLDLKTQHQSIRDEILKAVDEAVSNAQFIGGQQVSSFENEFAAFCGTRYAVGVNSGTDALRFALLAAGIGPGDGVLTVPNTFIATTEAITQAGGRILLMDVDDRTHLMDPGRLEREMKKLVKEGRPPKAIIPVHLFGHVADMAGILEVAGRYGATVIEDACQAHGALYSSLNASDKPGSAGSFGSAGCFSFYPGKNLGACGEGGAVVIQEESLAEKIRMLRDHGQVKKYYHEIEGYNGRLDAIQAAILRIKLRHLPEWNRARQRNAESYDRHFSSTENIVPVPRPAWSKSVYHLYVVKVEDRDAVAKRLAEKGVATALHYPIPLHLQNAYRFLGYKAGDFPVSEKHAARILSLPMFPELTQEQIAYVAEQLQACI
jgi:dTDP-4-amino-4,6-dideoxygalactose transaminase